MLPPGHMAAGFLSARLLALAVPALYDPKYLILSASFGFFPDLDFFLVFAKTRKLISSETINHRKFITHAPLLYLLLFAIWDLIFPDQRLIALTFLIGTWSHFIIDSFSSEGIPWLWPFSTKLYGFKLDRHISISEQRFFPHWLKFLKAYTRVFSFKAELVIFFLALLVLSINY